MHHSLLFYSECSPYLNINTVFTQRFPQAADPHESGRPIEETLAMPETDSSISIVSSKVYLLYIAIPLLFIFNVNALAPILFTPQEYVDPLEGKMDYWGYQRLREQIDQEQIRQIAMLVEYSRYPEFVKAIITVESGWDIRALSSKEARGLMQIRMIAAAEKMPNITPEGLYEPVTNVKLGIQIFEEHMEYFQQFESTEHWALTSYNRGRYGTFSLNLYPPTTDYSRKVLQMTGDFVPFAPKRHLWK